MDFVAAAQIISALGTLSLAVLAYTQVQEMKQTRLAQERPQVIVDADYSRRGLVDLVIRNIGKGAAKDITFKFSTPLVSRLDTEPGTDIAYLDQIPVFKDGLDYMAPAAEIRMIWDGSVDFWQFLKQQGLEDGITVVSRFESMSGRPDSTTWNINPLRLSRIPEASKDLGHLVEAVESIQKTLK